MARKHTLGTNMKIALAEETTGYGVKGSAASPGAGDKFSADVTESMAKEIIRIERGQIGTNGERQAGLAVGQTVAGAITGLLYFNDNPMWTAIATCIGEETVSGYGALNSHDFVFGENFYGDNTLERHATLEVMAGIDYPGGSNDLVYQMQSFKASSVEFAIDRDTGMKSTVTGTSYLCTREDIDSSTWTCTTDRDELVLTGNHCTMNMYIADYAAAQVMDSDDLIRPANVTIMFDQANDALPDTGTGLGIAEPVFTPSGRKCTVSWTQDFGDDDDDYGQRDWTSHYEDSTAVGIYITIVSTDGSELRFRFPRCLIDGPGKPIVSGPDVIAMNYSVTAYVPEETQTGTFLGLSSNAADIKLINSTSGTYLADIA